MSERSRIRTVLQIIGGTVLMVLIGLLIYCLELQRDSRLLAQAGAKIAAREDGSVVTLTLPDAAANDANLKHVGNLDRLLHLTLEGGHCSESSFVAMSQLSELRKLRLLGTQCPTGSLQALEPLPEVRSIELRNCPWVSNADVAALARHPNLEKLLLAGTGITDEILQKVSKVPTLKELTLEQNAGLTGRGLAALHGMTQLESLTVLYLMMESADLRALDEALPETGITVSTDLLTDMQPLLRYGIDAYGKHNPTDRRSGSAEFHNCIIEDGIIRLLAKHRPRIGMLSFVGSNLSDEHFPEIATFEDVHTLNIAKTTGTLTAAGFHQLTELPLRSVHLYLEGIDDSVLEGVGQLVSLQYLALSGRLTDAGTQSLSELENLKSLMIHDSPITGSHLDELATLGQLRYLTIYNSPLDDAGLLKIAKLPLHELTIHGTNVTPEGVQKFRELRSDVGISEF